MAQIKAETLHVCCTNRLVYPLTVLCNSEDKYNMYCDRKFEDSIKCGTYCEHSVIKPQFMERQFKKFEAYEHNIYDLFNECYDLVTSNAEYICSYLEIDGHVYCDLRDELEWPDPRIDCSDEGGDDRD